MQEAGRGRQRGQQLPGLRAGASSWPQPQISSDPLGGAPRRPSPGTEDPSGISPAHRERAQGTALWPRLELHRCGVLRPHPHPHSLPPAPRPLPKLCRLPPAGSYQEGGATCPLTPPPETRHSRGHRRAAGSAGSRSARCLPRRSKWCKRPRPSAPRRPPPGPRARTTGRGLRGQERSSVNCPSLTPGLARPQLPSFWLAPWHRSQQLPASRTFAQPWGQERAGHSSRWHSTWPR